jgi:hypothetical protein
VAVDFQAEVWWQYRLITYSSALFHWIRRSLRAYTRISLREKEITASLSEIFSHSVLQPTKKPVSHMEIFCLQKRFHSKPSRHCLSYKLRVSVRLITYMVGRQICTSQQCLSNIMWYSLQMVQRWTLHRNGFLGYIHELVLSGTCFSNRWIGNVV